MHVFEAHIVPTCLYQLLSQDMGIRSESSRPLVSWVGTVGMGWRLVIKGMTRQDTKDTRVSM